MMTEPDPHERLRRLERKADTIVSLIIGLAFVYVFDRVYDKNGLAYAILAAALAAGGFGAVYWWHLRK